MDGKAIIDPQGSRQSPVTAAQVNNDSALHRGRAMDLAGQIVCIVFHTRAVTSDEQERGESEQQ
jgi:hypothetical protein